jgi:iron complex outermembrane recepter protein
MKTILLLPTCAAALTITFAYAQAETVSAGVDAQPGRAASSSSETPPGQRGGSDLQEIVVTATRRSERLQDVPLSITAYSQQELSTNGIVGYEGLALQTPGVVLNKQSDNFNNFTARGIATNSYGANLQSTVAVYIDDLPISRIGNTTTLNPNLYDVEQVEFLRGPQGTLFGSGSLSGALRIMTKSPDLTGFHASAQVDEGMTGSDSLRQRYDAMINIPLVDNMVAVRAVGFYRHEDGWIDNIGTGKKNANTLVDEGGRLAMLIQPNERLSVKLLTSYEDSEPKDASLTSPSLGLYVRDSNQPDIYSGSMNNDNLTINYHFDGATLTSSSTYSRFNQKFFVDLAGTFGGAIAFGLDALGYQKTFVEETRLASDPGGKFDWVVGAYYLDQRLNVPYYYRSSLDFLQSHNITGLSNEFYEAEYTHGVSHELAGFGDLTYHINDQVWLTGGLRYSKVDSQAWVDGGYNSNYFTNALFGIPGPLTITPIAPAAGTKIEANKPSYKVSLSYMPSPSLTTYATVSTGFRAPVVNATAGSVSIVNPNDIVIPPGASSDNLTNYEIGAKGNWFDGRLSANVAVYLIDWSNIQIQANRVSDSLQFATNVGAARSDGIEFELKAMPLTDLTVGINGSIDHAKVTQLSPSQAAISGAVVGAGLSAPSLQGALYADYAFTLSANAKADLLASVQHVGAFPNGFPDVPGQPGTASATYGYTDTYNVLNANFRVLLDRRTTVSLYGENLADSHAVNYLHPEAFIASRYGRVQPRTIGIRLGYDF